VGQRGSANGETGCCSTSIDGVDVEGSVDSRLIQCDSAKAEEETMCLFTKVDFSNIPLGKADCDGKTALELIS
jgi:hypothetical protein